jgi:hypothetical protein
VGRLRFALRYRDSGCRQVREQDEARHDPPRGDALHSRTHVLQSLKFINACLAFRLVVYEERCTSALNYVLDDAWEATTLGGLQGVIPGVGPPRLRPHFGRLSFSARKSAAAHLLQADGLKLSDPLRQVANRDSDLDDGSLRRAATTVRVDIEGATYRSCSGEYEHLLRPTSATLLLPLLNAGWGGSDNTGNQSDEDSTGGEGLDDKRNGTTFRDCLVALQGLQEVLCLSWCRWQFLERTGA